MTTADWRTRNREAHNRSSREYYHRNRVDRLAYQKQYRDGRLQPCTYILYDHEGEVIYVGRTNQWWNRQVVHRLKSSWWNEVSKIKVRNRKTFADALVLESLLIRKYLPKYNADGVAF